MNFILPKGSELLPVAGTTAVEVLELAVDFTLTNFYYSSCFKGFLLIFLI